MKIILYLLILIFPFGQLLRWEPFGAESAIHFNDLFIGVVFLCWIVSQNKKIIQIRKNYLYFPVVIWVLSMVVSLVLNAFSLSFKELLISSLHILRWISYASLFFIVSDQNNNIKQNLLRLLGISGLVVGISGLMQYFFLPNVAFLSAQNWDDHYYRLIGTFLDPGFTGAILVLSMPLIFFGKNKIEKMVLFGISYLAMALTYSRASFLMFVSASGVVSWLRQNMSYVIFAIILMVITITLLPVHAGEGSKLGREYSIWSRVENWKKSAQIWIKNPIFGIGFNSYRYSLNKLGIIPDEKISKSHGGGADSSLMLVLATTGVVGLLAYLNLFRVILVRNRSVLVWASLIAVFIHSWFNNTLFYPWVMEWLWIVVATSSSS